MEAAPVRKHDDGLVVAHAGSTICELICVQLQRIHEECTRAPHEEEFVRLSNILLPNTKTYGVYILAIYQALENYDYGGALAAGRAMLQHEIMLHAILAGQDVRQNATLN